MATRCPAASSPIARLSTIDRGTGDLGSALEMLTTGNESDAAQAASWEVFRAARMPSPGQPTRSSTDSDSDSGAVMYDQLHSCSWA